MQKPHTAWVFALAAFAALVACDGARYELRAPVRTVWEKEDRGIITIATPRGPHGAVDWHDRLRIVATNIQPWHRAGDRVPDPNLANIAVIVAKAGSLTKELCPLSPGTNLPTPDTMVVFRMEEVVRVGAQAWVTPPVAYEREVVMADFLPKGSDYTLQYMNCENVGNYTYGCNGTAPSALSLTLEVSTEEVSTLALLARSIKGFVGGSWGKMWSSLEPV